MEPIKHDKKFYTILLLVVAIACVLFYNFFGSVPVSEKRGVNPLSTPVPDVQWKLGKSQPINDTPKIYEAYCRGLLDFATANHTPVNCSIGTFSLTNFVDVETNQSGN